MKRTSIKIIGWYGTIAIIAAYALVSFNLIQNASFIYQLLNLTGATGIIIVSWVKKAYQPAVLNIVWSIIAIIAIVKIAF